MSRDHSTKSEIPSSRGKTRLKTGENVKRVRRAIWLASNEAKVRHAFVTNCSTAASHSLRLHARARPRMESKKGSMTLSWLMQATAILIAAGCVKMGQMGVIGVGELGGAWWGWGYHLMVDRPFLIDTDEKDVFSLLNFVWRKRCSRCMENRLNLL